MVYIQYFRASIHLPDDYLAIMIKDKIKSPKIKGFKFFLQKVEVGQNGDDFIRNMNTVFLKYNFFKRPKIADANTQRHSNRRRNKKYSRKKASYIHIGRQHGLSKMVL